MNLAVKAMVLAIRRGNNRPPRPAYGPVTPWWVKLEDEMIDLGITRKYWWER